MLGRRRKMGKEKWKTLKNGRQKESGKGKWNGKKRGW